jgi:ankyrin repeat protein
MPDKRPTRPIDQALFDAVDAGDFVGVQRALAEGASPSARDERNQRQRRNALMKAAHVARPDLIELLLPVSDPREIDAGFWSAFHIAAHAGNVDSLRLLLPHSDPLRTSDSGHTPLMAAALHADVESVRLLLPVSDPKKTLACGDDALVLAAANCGVPSAVLCCELIAPHVDVNSPGRFGASYEANALLKAVDRGASVWENKPRGESVKNAIAFIRSLVLHGADGGRVISEQLGTIRDYAKRKHAPLAFAIDQATEERESLRQASVLAEAVGLPGKSERPDTPATPRRGRASRRV